MGTDSPLSPPSPGRCVVRGRAARPRGETPPPHRVSARQLRPGAGAGVSVALAVSSGEAIVFFSSFLIFFPFQFGLASVSRSPDQWFYFQSSKSGHAGVWSLGLRGWRGFLAAALNMPQSSWRSLPVFLRLGCELRVSERSGERARALGLFTRSSHSSLQVLFPGPGGAQGCPPLSEGPGLWGLDAGASSPLPAHAAGLCAWPQGCLLGRASVCAGGHRPSGRERGAFSGLCLPVMYSQRWECWHIAIAISKSKFNTSPKSTYDLRDNRLRWGSIQWGLRGLAGFVDSPPSSPSSAIVPLGLTYPWSLEDVTTARSHVCKDCTCFWGFASSETSRGESQASWSGTRSSLPFLPCPRCGLGHVAPPPPCLHPPTETQH